jgi:fructose-1,6-bisphosphatase/inositol monophosphatase family enzyme
VDDPDLLEVLSEAARAVHAALSDVTDWRPHGDRPGQYRIDLIADAAALAVLHGAGLTVLSEESGLTGPDGRSPSPGAGDSRHEGSLVVVDPVDGSTNASLGIPWYSTSLCVLDAEGPRVALVVNQASGVRYEAVRGQGARRDGRPIATSGCRDLAQAVVGISGYPQRQPGWAQFRALGSAALDHCAVAEGVLDGYRVCGTSWLHGWDYLGGMLMCTEAGGAAGELGGDDLVVRDASPRRPAVAATSELLQSLLTFKE